MNNESKATVNVLCAPERVPHLGTPRCAHRDLPGRLVSLANYSSAAATSGHTFEYECLAPGQPIRAKETPTKQPPNRDKSEFYPTKHPLLFYKNRQGMTRNDRSIVRNTLYAKDLRNLDPTKKCIYTVWPAARRPGGTRPRTSSCLLVHLLAIYSALYRQAVGGYALGVHGAT